MNRAPAASRGGLELENELLPSKELRHDHVVTAGEVGGRHRDGEIASGNTRLLYCVGPSSE